MRVSVTRDWKNTELVIVHEQHIDWRLPDSSVGKEPARNVGDLGSIPGLGRSPGEVKGYPF